ncbi:uncharacterized protein BT62DRAFT_937433, partial [Guyanagaster necrorhizus]
MEESPLLATSLIDVFGFGNVIALRDRTPLKEHGAMLFACGGEILASASFTGAEIGELSGSKDNHLRVTEQVMAWMSKVDVIPSDAYPSFRSTPPYALNI